MSQHDRDFLEVGTLVEALHQAGCHDQLNLGGSAALEVIARRLLQIMEAATSDLDGADWGGGPGGGVPRAKPEGNHTQQGRPQRRLRGVSRLSPEVVPHAV